jgi:diaminohydroxyphosphoribosylaminopyrimidine deaminase/5-amino-6-(5-phosphoribosylamino)uracil reductase
MVVGEGFHERFGAAHAEVIALGNAGPMARGSTLYVSLEPCCHHGKTPPCTAAVIAAGVARVVAAIVDPFQKVAGQGIAQLRAAGIAVDVGLLEDEARELNAPFIKLVTTGLPYIHAKWAMTLDGKIATTAGDSKWITGEAARAVAHELRGRMDAIVVGVNTAIIDDPLLTARPPGPRIATRIVIDSRGRLPVSSQLVRTAGQAPVVIATSALAPVANLESLREYGCECLVLPHDERGVAALALLQQLGKRNMTNLLIEGGSRVLGSFHDARAIDELHVFIAAKTLAGGLTPVSGTSVAQIVGAPKYDLTQVRQLGNDCLIQLKKLK